MSDVIVAQILTGCTTLLCLIITQLILHFSSKRSSYKEIITNQTIENMLFFRKAMSSLIILLSPEVIDSCREKDSQIYVEKLFQASTDAQSIMKSIFSKELELINTIRQAVDVALKYYKSADAGDRDVLLAQKEKCYYLYSIYDYSDWRYVKGHARKVMLQDTPDFDKIYDKLRKEFDETEKPIIMN